VAAVADTVVVAAIAHNTDAIRVVVFTTCTLERGHFPTLTPGFHPDRPAGGTCKLTAEQVARFARESHFGVMGRGET
jgi:hypothetical protein